MAQQSFVKDLIDPATNFDQWYVDVVRKADLADDAPVRGCKVVKPYGYALWENIQSRLDSRFKATGVENAYFPMLIPKSMLEREADHIEGFTPEVAWVTHAGGKELEEPLAIRPTSESIICPIFAGWVQSWRDLPIIVNQWASVLRWEERPRAFLRTSEFLWQEGHTVHSTLAEANDRALQMLEVYQDFLETELAIPVIPGVKSDSEKFAGAYKTYTAEAMMGGRFWALQACTSHNLSNHFGKVYDILFLDKDGERKHAYSTSWGMSHRVIGATVMVHGDASGIKMPPRVAPIQAVIVPILGRGDGTAVLAAARILRDSLVPDLRIRIDERDDRSPGYKFSDWELKGVPIRIELGPRDLAANQVVLALRDTGEKLTVPLEGVREVLTDQLASMQHRMYDAAAKTLQERTADVDTYDELASRVASNEGWNRVGWCGSEACETRVKTETKATIRCIPFDQPASLGPCIVCGNRATSQVIIARAY
ncbi:MAG: proline--tRNA ligase [Thermomicrobiales bacterium]